jgi:transcriptional regulator with XRE-family HTH domain
MDTVIEVGGSSGERLRREWGRALAGTMKSLGVTRKELALRLTARNAPVSVQAVGQWIRGETSPRPHMQAVIGEVLGVPAQLIFSIKAAS